MKSRFCPSDVQPETPTNCFKWRNSLVCRYYIYLARLPTSSNDLLPNCCPHSSQQGLLFWFLNEFSIQILPWYAGSLNYGPLFMSPTSSYVLSPSASQPVSLGLLSCPRPLSVGSARLSPFTLMDQFTSGPNKGGPVSVPWYLTHCHLLFVHLSHWSVGSMFASSPIHMWGKRGLHNISY